MADLEYNIEEELLIGKIGNTRIRAHAGSGGRAGSIEPEAKNVFLANNSLATHVGGESSQGTHSFGPLPRGLYTLKLHEKKKDWIRLLPHASNNMHGRSGFAIHGRGRVGSHGCLVPSEANILRLLCKLVQERDDNGRPPLLLQVVSRGPNIGWQNNLV